MNRLRQWLADLWNGRVPLARAFWEYAIVYGSLFSLFSTIAFFALMAGDYPDALAILVYLLPAPYIFLMVVAVWRSAGRYTGPAHWTTLARAIVILWAAVAMLT